jgi:hypothetical protein
MSVCDDCPIRLFNTKNYNLQGVGNPYYGRCIVVPNVDYSAYKKGSMGFSSQVEIIRELLSSTGEGDNVFILPLVRCNESISCELDNTSYARCLSHFKNDIVKYDFKDILLLGDAGRRFLNCDIRNNLNNCIISPVRRRYVVNYSPLIKYIDEDKFKTFEYYLLKWFNATRERNYSGYNIIRL